MLSGYKTFGFFFAIGLIDFTLMKVVMCPWTIEQRRAGFRISNYCYIDFECYIAKILHHAEASGF